jgi:hypothetical protein
MNIILGVLVMVVVSAVAIAAMVLVRRRAPGGMPSTPARSRTRPTRGERRCFTH